MARSEAEIVVSANVRRHPFGGAIFTCRASLYRSQGLPVVDAQKSTLAFLHVAVTSTGSRHVSVS